ncbi:hypothetical protein NBRC116495_35900 [Aurantivibrio plasticivorans]
MLPVLVIGLLSLIVLIAIEYLRVERAIQDRLAQEADHLGDTLVIASEANSSSDNLQRITFNIAAKDFIREIYVIDPRKNQIYASSQENLQYQHIENLPSQILTQYHRYVSSESAPTEEVLDNGIRLLSIQLIDESVNRLRVFHVIISLNPDQLLASGILELYTIGASYLIGLLFILAGVFWVQSTIVTSPLKRFRYKINEQIEHSGELTQIIEHGSDDELGLLVKAYNSLVERNSASKKIMEQQAAELIEAKDKADHANLAKSQFLASMNHEIRTPMNGMLGMIELLKKTNLDRAQRHKIGLAESSGKSLLSLINDILDFSKIEAGRMDVEYIAFRVRELLGEVAEAMAVKAQHKKVELILDQTNVNYQTIIGDPTRIWQILTNILGNAIKFTDRGEIKIIASLEKQSPVDTRLVCKIIDSGVGIPKEKIAELFSSFTQVDASTTRKYGGTGLGLAISRKLCQLMGGDIKVESKVGMGSCFEFFVDCGLEHCTEGVGLRRDIADVMGDVKLLVADSNQAAVDAIVNQLTKLGANVKTAKSVNEVEQYLVGAKHSGVSFDGLLVSNNLEDNMLEKIQALAPLSAETCIVLMTQIEDHSDPRILTRCGVSFSFSKPLTHDDLVHALAAIVLGEGTYRKDWSGHTEDEITGPTHASLMENKRVLVVEDNKINQEVIAGILDEYNLHPDFADNGLEALHKLASADAYDFILMDCQMPSMDGYQASECIRRGDAGERHKDSVIIALTANAMRGDRERCLASGMNDYLSKPIDSNALERMLTKWALIQSGGVDHTFAQPYIEAPNNTELWDKSSALKRVRGKEERLIVLMKMFIGEMPNRLQALEEAVRAEDVQTARELAHTIKGVAGNISANSTMEAAAALESAARDGDLSQLKESLAMLSARLASVNLMFEQYLD